MNAIKEVPTFPGLDMLSTAVIIIDEKGYVEYINPSAEHLFDISKKSATGLLLKKFFENPSA
jgi:two-component system nitrogen regulation sensor histidine kinase GlnL